MKQLVTLVLICLWFPLILPARVLTVSNNPAIKADFSGIQTAIEFAYSGDTIYVHGSKLNYGNIKITKPLTIIGAGYHSNNPDGFSAKLMLVEFTNNRYHNTSASNSTIQGFEFFFITGHKPGIQTASWGNHLLTNITIEDNLIWNINILHMAANWKIRNNIIPGQINGGSNNPNTNGGANAFLITNNIIASISDFSQKNLFQNNVILGQISNVSECTFLNNIFASEETLLSQVFNCTFRNNLSIHNNIGTADCYKPSNDFKNTYTCLANANNAGAGNIIGKDPQFVSFTKKYFDFSQNYSLNAGSPALTAGTDRKQLGIFGGPHPFPSWHEPNPVVYTFYKKKLNRETPKDVLQTSERPYQQSQEAITRKDQD